MQFSANQCNSNVSAPGAHMIGQADLPELPVIAEDILADLILYIEIL